MPLSDASMGADIKAALIAVFGPPASDDHLTKFSNAIGMAVVENIKANAVVVGMVIDGLVTTGDGSGGMVTGQLNGTVE